jgi:hypothetical protein
MFFGRMGIKAAQVIDFLIMHAHPLVRKKNHIIPGIFSPNFFSFFKITCCYKENVTDQLALWEAENYRVVAQDAVVLECRDSLCSVLGVGGEHPRIKEVFSMVGASLKKVNLLLWSSEETLMLAVHPVDNYLDIVMSFIDDCSTDLT